MLTTGTRVRALSNIYEQKTPGSNDETVPVGTEGVILNVTESSVSSFPYFVLWDGKTSVIADGGYPMAETEIEPIS